MRQYVMFRYVPTILFISVLAVHAVAGPLQVDSPSDGIPAVPAGKKGGGAGPAIVIGVLVAAGAGVGGYILYRRAKRERRAADSVITVVERAWEKASFLSSEERYREAIGELQSIAGYWYAYERYSARYRNRRSIHPDSIKAVIASCDFLERMIPTVASLNSYAERLPSDEFALSKMPRYKVVEALRYLRTSMDSIMNVHKNHRNGLQYSFRRIDRKLRLVDSLLEESYQDRKADFVLKNRFYYNRAVESGDTAALRLFVDDCEYYQVDREWCQRARMAMQEPAGAVHGPALPKGKMSAGDSIEAEFKATIQSKRIEVLEAYIRKYSGRKYRRLRRSAKIDEVKSALRLLQAEIEREQAFNRAHPRFANGDFASITLSAKGLAHASEEAFTDAWGTLRREVGKLPSIRFPAAVSIDYTRQPPVLMLDAVVSTRHDIERTMVNSRPTYRITCLLPVMRVLHQFKLLTMTMLNDNKTTETKLDEVTDYQIRKVRGATYVLRLSRPDNRGAILFYARGTDNDSTGGTVQFYDFYDLSSRGGGSHRFPIYPGSLPNVIPSLSSDTLEQKLGTEFFGE